VRLVSIDTANHLGEKRAHTNAKSFALYNALNPNEIGIYSIENSVLASGIKTSKKKQIRKKRRFYEAEAMWVVAFAGHVRSGAAGATTDELPTIWDAANFS